MKHLNLIWVPMILSAPVAFTQNSRHMISAVQPRLNAYSTRLADVSSAMFNPAAFSSVEKFSAASIAERRFMLNGLASFALAGVMPLADNRFGFRLAGSGTGAYHESEFSLAYSRAMGKITAGLQFNFLSMGIENYGKSGMVNFDASMMIQATDQLRAGVQIYNPSGPLLGKSAQGSGYRYETGFGYDASDRFFMGAAIIKTEDQPVYLETGMHYVFDQRLEAAMGASTGPTAFYVSGGFRLGVLQFMVSASLHQYLGITPSLLLKYLPPRK